MAPDRWKARRRLFVFATLTLWTGVFGVLHALQVAAPERPGHVPWDVRLQARWVEGLLERVDTRDSAWLPQGELFVLTLAGASLQNIAETTRDPEDIARAQRVVRALLPRLEPLLKRGPYKHVAMPRGGVCWFGGQNLLRGRYLALAGPDAPPEEVRRFHADSATLHRLFLASPNALLPTHPGQTWAVDNLFGYESLVLHDRLYGTRYGDALAPLLRLLERTRHRPTGLMASFHHLDGRPRDVPRGCAMGMSLAVLPQLAGDFSASQWRAWRRTFFGCAGGLCLVREYPPGHTRRADLDSGPILGGYGMSATAFGLAAARASGDAETAAALRRVGTLLGLPAVTPWGLRYWGGAVDLFQVLALWTRTVPLRGAAPSSTAWGLGALVLLAWALPTVLLARATRRALEALRTSGPSGSRWQAVLCALAVLAVPVHLLVPSVPFIAVGMGWALLGALGRRGPGSGTSVEKAALPPSGLEEGSQRRPSRSIGGNP
jgi:hypothetical protein